MRKKNKIIILGSNGFISRNLIKNLSKKKVKHIGINRTNCNLENKSSIKILKKIINKNDIIVFIAANAPVKNSKMLYSNIKICENICNAIGSTKLTKLIYVSSDAVYMDTKKKINENSICQSDNLHGVMHYTREQMLINTIKSPICIVRPTLVYGLDDPHNGYGPNSFFRNAIKDQDIKLFGNGEELRDHINIDEVTNILTQIVKSKKTGIYNLVTGRIYSFNHIAKKIIKLTGSNSKIITTKRIGKMPHNGYRAFNRNKLNKEFPNLKKVSFDEGIKKMIKQKNNKL